MTSSTFARQIILGLAVTVGFMLAAAPAQSQAANQYDKGTPPQFAAGVSSFGSYSSADLGTVNLSNGALNLKIPLVNIGGRGLSIPITLNWSSKIWSASIDYDQERGCGRGGDCDSGQPSMVPLAYADYANADNYVGYEWRAEAGWTVGGMPFMNQRIVRINYTNIQPRGPCYDFTLPKLSFTMPDRGEIEFRDDVYDGAPLPSDCSGWQSGYSRGRRWHATDGSGAIYISDVDNGASWRFPNLSGVVITADGTRFYLNAGGGCYSIVDRNGNKITATENGIVDPLGRTTTIQSNVPNPDNPSETLAVLVTVTGYGGQPRYYKVRSGTMNEHYRSDINPGLPVITGSYDPMSWGYSDWWPTTATKLFPLSYGLFVQRIDDRPVIHELVLPDQRSLRFNYNQFGEVAEVQMPTGGKVWYDYGSRHSLPSGTSPTWETTGDYHTSVWQVDRAVIQRRTFPDGNTLEGTWNYGFADSSSVVTATAPDGTLLLNQAHFFLPDGRYTESPYGGGAHTGTNYTLWSTGIEWRTETRDANGVMLAATEQDWTQRVPVSWPVYQQEQPANDNRVNQGRRYLDDGSIARTDTIYDNFNYPRANNVAEVWEYDFDQSLKRRTTTAYVTGAYQNDDAIHLLNLPLTQTVWENGNQVAQTTNEYDNYAGDGNHAPLADYGAVVGHDNNYNGLRITRGNLTASGRWLNTTNSHIYSYLHYDILGNVVGTKDARGNITTITFADDFGDGSNPGGGVQGTFGATYALPTLITSPPPNPGQQPHTARSQYDFSTGLLTGFRDRNGIIEQTFYNDAFNRPTLIKSALGVSGVESRTTLYYAPATTPYNITLANNDVLTAKDQNTVGDGVLRSWTRTDGYGRTVESWSRDPQGDVKVHTIFDPMGRAAKSSNPFRPSQGETAVYTTSVFDLMGRVTSVTTPDTAVMTTAYSGNTSTVIDQAGKKRRSVIDALGRLVRVDEPDENNQLDLNGVPVQPTDYGYDALDNLVGVNQGSQTRSFVYDSLKRIIASTTPEAGILHNSYDDNGNLLVRSDARGVAAHYSYDALNRMSRRWYNSSSSLTATTHNSPALPSEIGVSDEVKYFYDSQGLPPGAPTFTRGATAGRLVASTYGAASSAGNYHGYDDAGRSVLKIQQIGGVDYRMAAAYDLAGNVIGETYPSDRTVSYSYDNAGKTDSFAGRLGDGTQRNYSTGIRYSPFGGISQEQFGTAIPIYNKLFYNVRGQLSEIREGLTPNNTNWERGAIINFYGDCWGMCQGQPMPNNNGNLKRQEHWIQDANGSVSAIATQQFEYDELNRLKRVYEGTTWQEQYTYDRYGNRRVDVNNTSAFLLPKAFELESSTNRLLAPGDSNLPHNQRQLRYDAAGNMTNDGYTGLGQRAYDAENRMTAAQGGVNGAWQTYAYDCDGRRVKRTVNGIETWQVYGFAGELVAEYPQNGAPANPQKEYGYRNGQLLITATSGSTGWGTPPTFQDNPIVTAETPVRSLHITELRAAIDAVRSHYNLGAYPWQAPAAPGDPVSIAPIEEMRTALDHALGAPAGGYAAGLVFGQPILKFHIQELRNRVLAAWQSGAGGVDIRWLVNDQLGTPRMMFDQSGSLASVIRHDYLPFGQELFAAGRTPGNGYTNADNTRQRFTGYERDGETGLDFAQARYYANIQGRFTSTDPLASSARLRNPQTWNRYSYVLNNPVRLVDPEGLSDKDPWKLLQELLEKAKRKKTPARPAEQKNPTSPKAPVTGSADFKTPFFSELSGTKETQAAHNLLVASYGQNAGSVYDSWTEYDQAVFLNTVAAMQDAFGDRVSWDGIKFEGFYVHERNGLPYGIKVSGVTDKMLNAAGLGKVWVPGMGRRSPEAINTASLEATKEGSMVEFDIDLYNAKSEFKKHQGEVGYNRDNGVTTHPADVTRALNARGVRSGVRVP